MNLVQHLAMQGFLSVIGIITLFLLFTFAVISMDDGPLRNSIIGGILAALMFAIYGGHI